MGYKPLWYLELGSLRAAPGIRPGISLRLQNKCDCEWLLAYKVALFVGHFPLLLPELGNSLECQQNLDWIRYVRGEGTVASVKL